MRNYFSIFGEKLAKIENRDPTIVAYRKIIKSRTEL
jgi:hypothetical protein